jgi:polyhydroxyalkanoate synthesis regulator phasin
MAEPADMILPLLPEMRAENAELHEQTRELIKALDKRLGVVEGAQGSFRQALTADTLLSKLVTGEFEGRIEALERKVRELERQK